MDNAIKNTRPRVLATIELQCEFMTADTPEIEMILHDILQRARSQQLEKNEGLSPKTRVTHTSIEIRRRRRTTRKRRRIRSRVHPNPPTGVLHLEDCKCVYCEDTRKKAIQ